MLDNDILEKAKKFPLQLIIARYSKDHSLPLDLAATHAKELVRFLTVCAINPNKRYTMLGPIDEFWHTFLMFTEEYSAFCHQIAGRFLHHIPATPLENEDERKNALAGYREFLKTYQKVFHEEPPKIYWPNPKAPTLHSKAGCANSHDCFGGCFGGCFGCRPV